MMEKEERLKQILEGMGSVAVAFSGGVDSTYLLKVAHDTLGDGCVAVTAKSPSFPAAEQDDAANYCRQEGIRQIVLVPGENNLPEYRANPTNRCYICKKAIFTALKEAAKEMGIPYVAEGTNMDDRGDYRPGLAALEELGIRSPLMEAGLSKEEIRECSRKLGLPTADRPSFACLATRIPYGDEITAEKLSMVERAEDFLRGLGFRQYRVRLERGTARIEVFLEDFDRIMSHREEIVRQFLKIGFAYVALDLEGFASGKMNRGVV